MANVSAVVALALLAVAEKKSRCRGIARRSPATPAAAAAATVGSPLRRQRLHEVAQASGVLGRGAPLVVDEACVYHQEGGGPGGRAAAGASREELSEGGEEEEEEE